MATNQLVGVERIYFFIADIYDLHCELFVRPTETFFTCGIPNNVQQLLGPSRGERVCNREEEMKLPTINWPFFCFLIVRHITLLNQRFKFTYMCKAHLDFNSVMCVIFIRQFENKRYKANPYY